MLRISPSPPDNKGLSRIELSGPKLLLCAPCKCHNYFAPFLLFFSRFRSKYSAFSGVFIFILIVASAWKGAPPKAVSLRLARANPTVTLNVYAHRIWRATTRRGNAMNSSVKRSGGQGVPSGKTSMERQNYNITAGLPDTQNLPIVAPPNVKQAQLWSAPNHHQPTRAILCPSGTLAA